jgi:hypothetical protein
MGGRNSPFLFISDRVSDAAARGIAQIGLDSNIIEATRTRRESLGKGR